jgi:hypothetical protein
VKREIEREQPEPQADYAVVGTAQLTRSDFAHVWWHVPAAGRARTLFLTLTPFSFFFGLGIAASPHGPGWAATIPLLVVVVPQCCLSLARRWFARRRFSRLGSGSVAYRLSGDAVTLETEGGSDSLAWSHLNGFLVTEEAFVLYPKGAGLWVMPKRAFEGRDAHVQWFLRRRLHERRPARWGLRFAAGLIGTVAFLCAWHFLSSEQPAPSLPDTSSAPLEAAPTPKN